MIQPMNEIDAVTLLQKKLGAEDRYNEMEELASVLEGMPLALVQAAAYIQQKGAEVQRTALYRRFPEKRQTKIQSPQLRGRPATTRPRCKELHHHHVADVFRLHS